MTYTERTACKTVAGEASDAAWIIIAIKKKRQDGAYPGGGARLDFGGYLLENEGMDLMWLYDFQKCRLLLVRARWNKKQCYYWIYTLKY